MTVVLVAIACGLIAVLYGFVTSRQVLASSAGSERMIEIAAAIQEGAKAYLNKQYTTIAIVGVVVAIVVFLIISALLAPPDPFSQIGLTVPLYLLYEFSIQAVVWVERQKKRKQAEQDAALGS